MAGTSTTSSKVTIEGIEATATNAFVVSAPQIVQYPKPCDLKNGKWYAIPAIIGAGFRAMLNKTDAGLEDESKKAEEVWKALLTATNAIPGDLLAHADDLFNKATSETALYNIPALLQKTHDYALCGCTSDLMALRLSAGSNKEAINVKSNIENDINATSRFNVGRIQQGYQKMEAAVMADRITTGVVSREATVASDWACSYDLLTTALYSTEQVILNRKKAALEWYALYIMALGNIMKTFSWLSTTKHNAAVAKGASDADFTATLAQAAVAGIALLLVGSEISDAQECAKEDTGTTTGP